MAGQYHIDLERFSLEKFRHILETSEFRAGIGGSGDFYSSSFPQSPNPGELGATQAAA